MDVAGFIGKYPPFDALTPEELERVTRAIEIEHFAAGTEILQQGGMPTRHLYVVRKGAVEIVDDGRVLDVLGEGETFGMFSLLGHAEPTSTVRALEDTLCYLIGEGAAHEVLGTSAGQMFVIGTMRQRLGAGVGSEERPAAPYQPVGALIRRGVVAADPGSTVAKAAERMAEEHVSCVLVPMRGGWGIVTDRDLRSRVLATGRSPETPVEDIASFPVKTLSTEALAGEALLTMFEERAHHFPVTGPDGTMIGVVDLTDLMDLGRHTPLAIRGEIDRARTLEDVVAAGRQLPDVVRALVEASSEPVGVGRVVALVVDALTERLLRLGIDRFGEPPVAWAWLALGSAARYEQALHTDQDHALAYDPQDRPVEEIDPYFADLAGFVTDGLEDVGIPRCVGDAMAVNEALRRSVDGWVEAFKMWMQDVGRSGSILSSIVYDFRRVAGPLDPEPTLDAVIRGARGDLAFLRHLAHRALDARPPTGFRGNLAVERRGEHEGRLDLKHGGITAIGNLARVYAVRTGIPAKPTLDRLRGAAAEGGVEEDLARELAEAFRFLWEIRLRHQAEQVRADQTPDDFLDPSALGPVARRGLKEAFHVIARAQRALATEYGIRQL